MSGISKSTAAATHVEAGSAASVCSSALRGVRVIIVSHGFQPNYERGFANGVARNGAEVTLISSDRTQPQTLARSIEVRNLRRSQDSSRPRWAKALNMLRYHASLLWLSLCQPNSIVHVTGLLAPVLWCGIVEGIWFRFSSRRYVLTIHNLVPHDAHTRFNSLLYGWAYKLPHELVVHTQAMKQQLMRDHALDARRIHVMEHGIEPIESSAEPLPGLRTGGPLCLLFFGALMRYKGLDLLLQALTAQVPAFRLQIAGPCVDAALAREFEAAIASHPHKDWITWNNSFIPEDEVGELFGNADVAVLPYRHIDQSGVLFQAFRYGLPVIATDVGSLRQYVADDTGLVCEPNSPQALAQALCRFEQCRSTFSRHGIREQARRYEWHKVAQTLQGPYAVATAGTYIQQ